SSKYEEVRRHSSGGVQPNLNLQIIKSMELWLPPRDRVEILMNRAEELLTDSREVLKSAQLARSHLARLRQSILTQAFEGKLILQDPDDEPASFLLERIRFEC